MSFNKVIITVRLASKIELKKLNDLIYTNFSVILDDNKKEKTFLKCVAFNESAIYLNKYSNKGCLLLIDGKLRINKFKDKNQKLREQVEILIINSKIMYKINNTKNTIDEEERDNFIKRIKKQDKSPDIFEVLGIDL